MKVDIYIHITHKGNPRGEGTAAGVIEFIAASGTKHTREVAAESTNDTKNALTLSIIVLALKVLIKPCEVALHFDNDYIKSCIVQGWLQNWQQAGWLKANKKPPANVELWKMLYISLKLHKVQFFTV